MAETTASAGTDLPSGFDGRVWWTMDMGQPFLIIDGKHYPMPRGCEKLDELIASDGTVGGTPVSRPPSYCRIHDTHEAPCPACIQIGRDAGYRDSAGAEGPIESVARALARAYWRGRGETITKDQEDEFWLSWSRDAEAALSRVEGEKK